MSAGWSADAKAAKVARQRPKGFLGRLRAAVGLDGAERAARAVEAARWAAGAEGERRTAAMLTVLGKGGWGGFYDRALPGGGRANADHVLIPPSGTFVVLVDSKLWSGRWEVRLRGGRLLHGDVDRQKTVDALLHEAATLLDLLGCPVMAVMAVHNAPVRGGRLQVRGIEVMDADRLVPFLRAHAAEHPPDRARYEALAQRADRNLPRYVEGGGR